MDGRGRISILPGLLGRIPTSPIARPVELGIRSGRYFDTSRDSKFREMTGAQIVCETLKREGVEVVFGIPGGANLPLNDALGLSGIRFVLTRHEQGASHMADGYARATGR